MNRVDPSGLFDIQNPTISIPVIPNVKTTLTLHGNNPSQIDVNFALGPVAMGLSSVYGNITSLSFNMTLLTPATKSGDALVSKSVNIIGETSSMFSTNFGQNAPQK